MLTIEAEIDTEGNVKIHTPVSIQGPRRALVIILDEPPVEEPNEAPDFDAENRVWAETLQNHADKFAALKAQAKAEAAQGQTIDAFDENDEFVLK